MACYGCGGQTDIISNAKPHENWRDAADSIRIRVEDSERVVPDHPELNIPIITRDGHFFINSWDVVNAGHQLPLQPDTLVQVGDLTFEVGGYSDSRREYWILLCDEKQEIAGKVIDAAIRQKTDPARDRIRHAS